jgi:hypothetical protein
VSGLDVYGLRATLTGDWPEVLEQLLLDLAWFRAEVHGDADVQVEVQRRSPDFGAFGPLEASFVTPRNVVYEHDGLTVIDYLGRALSVLDRAAGRLTIQGEDEHLVHEAGYRFLLARIGEHLDRIGLARLHALGLSTPGGAVALMLPSGGGRSALALRAVEADSVGLLSEDSPLMDRNGRLYPFPLRIDASAHIESEPQPIAHLVVGRRSLGTTARLERLPKRAAAGRLLREAVVGVGLYQGMELVLQRGAVETLRQARPAAARTAACAALLRRAQVWRLTLGRDDDENWRGLAPLLER